MSAMDFDDASPRARPGDLATQLAREDLDHLSVAELDERIILLSAEIERTRAKRDSSVHHKASAEALFKRRGERGQDRLRADIGLRAMGL